MATTGTRAGKGPGRPAAASREDVFEAATSRYLDGQRVDVQAIATELGLGRTTIYRWFGSREKLIGAVLNRLAEQTLSAARKGTSGKGGPGLLETFDRYNRAVADAPALRAFVEEEHEAALRIIASGAGPVQPHVVGLIAALIEEEVESGSYEATIEPATLAYAVVRLGEAFLFNDAVAGIRGDIDRLREVQAALLGIPPGE